jgi:chorismate dehydratase
MEIVVSIFYYLCAVKLNELEKIKVGIVNYLNAKPLIYGLQQSAVINDMELITDYPSNIARLLLDGHLDMGLVPVAVIPHLREYHINTNWCIGCDGPVASVCLFSEVPVEQVETVLLDYQSRTSVALAKILLRDHWNIEPQLVDTQTDFRANIKGTTAGVVIGDRALEQRRQSAYVYDLGEAWKAMTGLPFVFAAWVSNKKLPDDFIASFDEANEAGVNYIPRVVASTSYPVFDLHAYYTRFINYQLDQRKREALKLFLAKITEDAREPVLQVRK